MTDKKKVKLYLLIIPFVTMLFYSLVVLGNIYILSRKNELISPAFSGRISLDEKISWLASHLSNGCDVLAIGSSMTLTNVNSAVITKAFPGMSYINAASWGMTPRHDLQMLRLLMNYCAPKILILACNLWDFRNDDTAEDLFDKNDVENFLNTKDYAWAYLKYFSVDYYWKRAGSIDAMRNEKHRYNTLDFDGHGGAPISYID